MADQGGTLPRWPMAAGYTHSMFGNPADLIFTESYLKGIDGIDYEKALEYMKKSSESSVYTENREYAELYNEYGYVPDDLSNYYSVSRTLEYAWEDSAIAVLAEKLGHSKDAQIYAARAMNYKNIWNSDTGYFQPKNADGSWVKINPTLISFYDDILGTDACRAYCEGSARQWRWNVMHDIDGMIDLFGSKEHFVSELNDFMSDASLNRAALSPGSGYWIGNQHDIHTAYLFNNAERPDLTQKWVRWTLSNRFSTDIDGLDGNDDGGTLSTWYIFSAMGFYPNAGSSDYWIGSPCVDSAEIRLSNGKTLKITVNNQGEKNIYVQSVTFNGKKLDSNTFSHDMIKNGGEFVFTMSNHSK